MVLPPNRSYKSGVVPIVRCILEATEEQGKDFYYTIVHRMNSIRKISSLPSALTYTHNFLYKIAKSTLEQRLSITLHPAAPGFALTENGF